MKYLRRFNTESEKTGATIISPNVSEVDSSENVYYDNQWTTVEPNQSEYWTANWQFIRPSDWPDLDIFDWTDTYGAVATYDCSRRIANNTVKDAFYLWVANYCNVIVERGTIINGQFIVDNTVEVIKNTYYVELLPTNLGRYVIYKITLDNDSGYFQLSLHRSDTYTTTARSTIDNSYAYTTTCCELQYKMPSCRVLLNPKSPFLRHYKTLCNPGQNGVLTSISWNFHLNNNLECIDTTGWDLSKVIYSNNDSSLGLFLQTRSLRKIKGIENWILTSYNTCGSAFQRGLYEELDLRNWEPVGLTNTGYMFQDANALRTVNLAGWDTSSVTTVIEMFERCYRLKSINLTGWTFSKVTTTNARLMFNSCTALTEIKMSKNLSFELATTFNDMFNSCYLLEDNPFNGATIVMDKVTNLSGMFAYNYQLREMDMTNWDFTAVTNTANMFIGCEKLRKVIFPSTCTFLTNTTLNCCFNLEIIVVLATTPPTYALTTGYLSHFNPNYKIYVPNASVDSYKTASGWLNAVDHIYSINELS